ncbi:eukaryotic translation initiation factor 2-alpha kinase [Anoplolepis gracilipes]|uniref:eukaryotic translation initiation factor 2-alpha kinase n=1 Tax=Anoplolepis gracilipes TaxID=354296 RepID=UPI003BA01143
MSSSRVWQKICFYYLVFVTTNFFVFADDTIAETGHLTLCGQQSINTCSLIFVSTLDGKITALDVGNYGQKQWTLDFNDGPILSSSIHNINLRDNGQAVRFIPSLNGGLYKFDGETLESVPISTDEFLYSSFRYSDNLEFSGGKNLHIYGVSASTGRILYECKVKECKNNTVEEHLEYDILVIRRFQQTVRAIEPHTGNERWNFSVGEYNLKLERHVNDCSDTIPDVEIKAIISEGLIWAINKSNPTEKLWKYQFDVPIVSIWRKDTSKTFTNQEYLENKKQINHLKHIDLFDDSQWIWRSAYASSPSLYLGMHERQLYVQENPNLENSLDLFRKNVHIKHKKYFWQPHRAHVTALTSTFSNENNNNEVSDETSEAYNITALAVLHNAAHINGNGFFLYSTETEQLIDNELCNKNNIKDNITKNNINIDMKEYIIEKESNIPLRIMVWWKEILIILIATIILWNSIQYLLNGTITTMDAVHLPLIIERHIETKRHDSANDDSENASNFKSRYLMDFEPVDCLGKGGYGVVFEAKNKIDDCNYAIKRIGLPNSQDSRERVMREVKALAKLDHHNIVRYFNAWLECPPSGWQEEHDQQWVKQKFSSSTFPSEATQTETKPNDSVSIDISQTNLSSVDSACKAFKLNNIDDLDDSFIVFEKSDEKHHNNDAICINHRSTDCSSDLSFSSNEPEKELNMNYSSHSESIVFEETDNNIVVEEKKHKRQKSFSLNLHNKSNSHKSAKMFLYIQMQLCQRLSLREWLKQHTIRDSVRVLNIFQQIVDAVEYVHLQGLIHRDLKPSNIFFAFDDKIKIGDFGLVTAMTESSDGAHTPAAENENVTLKNSVHTAHVGTHLYMSPEQMNGQMYNYKVDIYSLGIIFFELLIPFFTDMERIVALSNLKNSIFPKDFAEKYFAEYNLLNMMLDKDPAKRPTTLGIKARPPLQNYEIVRCNIDKESKLHFELPQLIKNSSTSSNSNTESSENTI